MKAYSFSKNLPCTNLTTIRLEGNPANDTTVAIATQQKALQKVCDDQRCHANIPASESCDMMKSPATSNRTIWEFISSDNQIDKPDYFYWPYTAETLSSQSTLALPDSTSVESASSLLTGGSQALLF